MKTAARSDSAAAATARRSRGRPAVPVERIVTTALELIDAEGADALSMRSLAQRLESGTATLYRHFADRTALIAAIVDRVFSEVELDERRLGSMTWQKSCSAVAGAMFEALSKHPNVTPLLVEIVPVGPSALRLRERGVANLLANGFSPKRAVLAWATLAHYVLGFAIQASRIDSLGEESGQLSEILRGLDAAEFPATVAVADSMPIPIEEEFAFGLDLMIKGLNDVAGRGG